MYVPRHEATNGAAHGRVLRRIHSSPFSPTNRTALGALPANTLLGLRRPPATQPHQWRGPLPSRYPDCCQPLTRRRTRTASMLRRRPGRRTKPCAAAQVGASETSILETASRSNPHSIQTRPGSHAPMTGPVLACIPIKGRIVRSHLHLNAHARAPERCRC